MLKVADIEEKTQNLMGLFGKEPIIEIQADNKRILRLEEWTEYNPERFPELKNFKLNPDLRLKNYLKQLNKSKKIIILELKEGLYIKTKANIGFLQLGDVELIIQPKIEKFDLMQLIAYVFNLQQIDLHKYTNYNFDKTGFIDLLIIHLEKEIRKLWRKGFFKTYVKARDDLSIIRGKIDIKNIVGQGGIRSVQIPCNYHDRSHNILINQILVSSLKLGIQLTNLQEIRINLLQLYKTLKYSINPIKLSLKSFGNAYRTLNRLTRAYEPILNLIYLLWSTNIPNIYGKYKEVPISGFLLDMNKFFEDLIAKFLKASLENYVVYHPYSFSNMISYIPEYNPKNHKIKKNIYPDFVIFQNNKCFAVLDAKYRDLWNKNLPIKWLYQLCVYSLHPIAERKSFIIYPTTEEGVEEAKIEVKNPITNKAYSTVILKPVRIPKLIEVIKSNDSKLKKQFAISLISD